MTPKRVTLLGLATNVGLAAVKVSVGLLTGTRALLADGLHSISDLASDAAVLLGLRFSGRPADDDHHYGHRRVATLVSLAVGLSLLVTAGWIIYDAISSYGQPHTIQVGLLPLLVAIGSMVPKELLYHVTRRVGQREKDPSVVANAWHHRTDAFTSLAAAAGIAGATFGGRRWAFLDRFTAALLAAFLAVTAVKLVRDAVCELIDRAPGREMVRRIGNAIDSVPGVRTSHRLRVRQMAGSLTLDVHILVDPELSVAQGHNIATAVQEKVDECECDILEAVVHVEPDDEENRSEE
ncbi:MAG: cation diffusion facilitator family transporter [Candidatus Fermentibacteraceae bacterium]